jgi:tRNA uridine 5-carboxymethylaminomethyl modification enzyme
MKSFHDSQKYPYDVIVCGAGHAGCEAALAASRIGSNVLLLTGNLDTIAQMSCNPAIGGQAKGQIVREIDALGGEMALNTDHTAIQFKLLNSSKGPAVQAPRAQCDKKMYQQRIKHVLELAPNITVFQTLVNGLIIKNDTCIGVRTSLELSFFGKSVIVTTGTFLRALMHVGKNQSEGGRLGDHVSKGLSYDFEKCGIVLERFKTGTPPRLLGKSINFQKMKVQEGDEHPTKFAFYDTRTDEETFHVEHHGRWFHVAHPSFGKKKQVTCYTTRTSTPTSDIINANLHLSPLYKGDIVGTGPRYCPSIEDKVVRFKDHPSHLIHLEPEGRNTDEWYVNGLSTSLPFDVQKQVLSTISGLENSIIIRPAYAVEYDYAPPTQLDRTLQSLHVENLFFAGQINGTSGYEEAAAQGLIAGINASNKVHGLNAVVVPRDHGYIGVLIDDLVTKGVTEPYRMFTSRAEFRLLFNHGSSELRYLPILEHHSLVSKNRLNLIRKKFQNVEEWIKKLNQSKASGDKTFGDLIRQGEQPTGLPKEFIGLSAATQSEVLYKVKYQGYLKRELNNIRKLKEAEKIRIPLDFAYHGLPGLRSESAEKLARIRPESLAQASRISGVNPSDISVLMVLLSKSQMSK